MSVRERQVRDVVVLGVMTVLLLFWTGSCWQSAPTGPTFSMRFPLELMPYPLLPRLPWVVTLNLLPAPVFTLSGLLSYKEILKVAPWLARLLDTSPRLSALVQNSLPSTAIIAFNGLLPFLLQCTFALTSPTRAEDRL